MEILKRLVREEEGQGMVEYALIIALVAIGLVTVAATGFDGALDSVIANIKAKLDAAAK